MIAAFARVIGFGEQRYLKAAEKAADFILMALYSPGRAASPLQGRGCRNLRNFR